MVAIVRKDVMKRENIRVESEGELVVMHFGNTEVKMKYEAALLFSQWVRVKAKEAKLWSGDNGRHWSVIGTLSDANDAR